MKKFVTLLILFSTLSAFAQSTTEAPSPIGMNYFSFWDGPSLENGKTTRNEMGRPQDAGLSLWNLVSTTYKVTDRYSVDLQTRLQHIYMTYRQERRGGGQNDLDWRFQGLRIGISGTLAKGEKWSLRGAFNTDVPEFNGRNARLRKTILNPGLFSGLNVQLTERWSIYAILSPRIFFYTDDDAIEPEWTAGGRSAGEKPRLILAASPSINYAINDKTGLRAGLDLSFRQFVESDPMYLKRWPTSASVGPTFAISKSLNLYPYLMAWPFDGKKLTKETMSVGAWINGIIF